MYNTWHPLLLWFGTQRALCIERFFFGMRKNREEESRQNSSGLSKTHKRENTRTHTQVHVCWEVRGERRHEMKTKNRCKLMWTERNVCERRVKENLRTSFRSQIAPGENRHLVAALLRFDFAVTESFDGPETVQYQHSRVTSDSNYVNSSN